MNCAPHPPGRPGGSAPWLSASARDPRMGGVVGMPVRILEPRSHEPTMNASSHAARQGAARCGAGLLAWLLAAGLLPAGDSAATCVSVPGIALQRAQGQAA